MTAFKQPLRSFCDFIGRGISPKYVEVDGIVVVNQKCIRDGRVDFAITRLTHKNTTIKTERLVRPWDILVNSTGTGTLGRTASMREFQGNNPITVDSHVTIVRPNPELISPGYLALRIRQCEDAIVNMARGATNQVELSALDLGELLISVLSRPAQDAIAEKIFNYDDLIENNVRRIELLDEAARLIYREWFISLRYPGHEHTKFVDGVPEGWDRTTIAKSTDFLSRGISPSYDDDAPCLVLNQKCIRDGLLDLGPARHQSKKVPVAKLVRVGDVLVNSTGAGTLGRVAQVLEEVPDCTVDSHVTIVRPREGLSLTWFGMTLISMQSVIEGMGKGATNQTELSKTDLGELRLTIPSESVLKEFDQVVAPLRQQVQVLRNQNKALQKARDLLLPRLMSGEIAI
jgi:type I restriction enzyme S subunit